MTMLGYDMLLNDRHYVHNNYTHSLVDEYADYCRRLGYKSIVDDNFIKSKSGYFKEIVQIEENSPKIIWTEGENITEIIKGKMFREYSKYPMMGYYDYDLDERIFDPKITQLIQMCDDNEE